MQFTAKIIQMVSHRPPRHRSDKQTAVAVSVDVDVPSVTSAEAPPALRYRSAPTPREREESYDIHAYAGRLWKHSPRTVAEIPEALLSDRDALSADTPDIDAFAADPATGRCLAIEEARAAAAVRAHERALRGLIIDGVFFTPAKEPFWEVEATFSAWVIHARTETLNQRPLDEHCFRADQLAMARAWADRRGSAPAIVRGAIDVLDASALSLDPQGAKLRDRLAGITQMISHRSDSLLQDLARSSDPDALTGAGTAIGQALNQLADELGWSAHDRALFFGRLFEAIRPKTG